MKITVEIEQQDYITMITPFRNGCSWRARFESNGKVTIEPGCYLLANLSQGLDLVFLERWRENGKAPVEVCVTPETRGKMMQVRHCSWCGGSISIPEHGGEFPDFMPQAIKESDPE